MTNFVEQVPAHDPDADDDIALAATALDAFIPVAGPVLAGLLERNQRKRSALAQHEFNLSVARELDKRNASGDGPELTVADLIDSDEFNATFERLAREARESSSRDKRRRLAAATAKSGEWSQFSASLRTQFARLVVSLDDLSVFLLHYFMSPAAWLEAHGLQASYPPQRGGSPEDPLVTVFGAAPTEWGAPVKQAIADMNLAGLTDVDLELGREGDDYLQRGTTPKGELFLQYISEPYSKDAPIPLVI